MSWVIDASVAAKWFLQEEGREIALSLLPRRNRLHAPKFILVELANLAWLKVRRGEILSTHASRMPLFASHAFGTLHEDAIWLPRALELAIELNHPVYDCLYLASAESLKATIITADRRFLGKIARTKHENRAIFLSDLPPP
jgi:predicted nucleic acid-binding protein